MKRTTYQDQVEVTNVWVDDPRGGSEPDHSEDSDADNDTTDYDDSPN